MSLKTFSFSNPRVRVFGIVLVAVLASILMIKQSAQKDEPPVSSQEVVSPAPMPGKSAKPVIPEKPKTVASETILPYKSQHGPLPATLEGTIMRQSLAVDEAGNLRISSDIQRIFDFFLSAIEQEDLSVILLRISEYLEYYLDPPALDQALGIMEQYVAFKKALFEFELERTESIRALTESPSGLTGDSYIALLEEQLAAQKDLRSLHLDPQVHEAFYADEEIYDDYSLARMKVQADKTLSEIDKQARLAEIDAQAPPELVESRKEAQLTDILKQKTTALKASGADASEIKALRTDMLGPEAAERFEILDQERAQWQQRVDDYLAQKQGILATEGLTEEARLEQINQLRKSRFDEREQIRVSVYEKRAETVK